MADAGRINDAAVRNDRVVDLGTINFGRGQKPRAAENRSAHIKKIELRKLGRAIDVRFEKRANRSDVFPVALENVREDPEIGNSQWDDMLAEVGVSVFEQSNQDI